MGQGKQYNMNNKNNNEKVNMIYIKLEGGGNWSVETT
jgi:hypothetical protein